MVECKHNEPLLVPELNVLTGKTKKVDFCSFKRSVRTFSSFSHMFPNSIGPSQLVRLFYWFSQRLQIGQLNEYCGLAPNTGSDCCSVIRRFLTKRVLRQINTEKLGDREDTVVCIDETFFTSPKVNVAGFHGRETAGHQKIVLGMYEINRITRKGTGRCHLMLIPTNSRAAVEAAIRKHVAVGAEIWTDGAKCYEWIDAPNSGYTRQFVVHSAGEFVRGEVSTNAVEGLFSRVKRFNRIIGVQNICKSNYGDYLGEFLWRERNLSATALGVYISI